MKCVPVDSPEPQRLSMCHGAVAGEERRLAHGGYEAVLDRVGEAVDELPLGGLVVGARMGAKR